MELNLVSNLLGGSNLEQTIAHMVELWEHFLDRQVLPPGDLRPTILNSWQRCLDLQVNPQGHTPLELSPAQVQNRLQTREEYQDVIQPVITSMEHLADLSKFIVAFTDPEGFILMIHGNEQLGEEVYELNFRIGANWSEQHVGTNAIGTVLATGQPSQVFHAEHFCRGLHRYACTAVPIRDPFSQEVIGVLDFASHIENHQPHIFGMATQMGRCIELEIYRKKMERENFFRERSLELTLDHLERGVIVLDVKGCIRRVNLKALDYLDMESTAVLNRTFRDLSVLTEWRNLEKPFRLPIEGGNTLRLSRKPLVHQRRLIGSLILLEPEKKSVRRLASPKNALVGKPVGRSSVFLEALQMAERAANFDSNVLITGDTGTGKEILAHYIHEKSQRRNGLFVAVNCGSIPRELLGSELFGYEAGAFTGADKKGRASKFEVANGGTLLLDEISEMPRESQVYLLRVIEDMALTRLGGTQQIPVDVRIVATSNMDLYELVKAGRFRADLFYRLNVVSIGLPPLKDRKEDIPLLVDHFKGILSESLSKKVTGISNSALNALMTYEWPGNVRELRNVLEHAIVNCLGETIDIEFMPEQVSNGGAILADFPEKERKRYLNFLQTYRQFEGNISQVARALNVSRPTIYAWRKKLGLK